MTTDSARRRFNQMVLPHLDDAYGLARWLTGNRTDAEDVVQDACIRALASLETAVVERPRPWVLTIVRNTAFSWLAKNRPRAVVLTSDLQQQYAATAHRDSAPDPEEADRRRRRIGAGIRDPDAAAYFQGSHRDARHQRNALS